MVIMKVENVLGGAMTVHLSTRLHREATWPPHTFSLFHNLHFNFYYVSVVIQSHDLILFKDNFCISYCKFVLELY